MLVVDACSQSVRCGPKQVCGPSLAGLGVPDVGERTWLPKSGVQSTEPPTPVQWLAERIGLSEQVINNAHLYVFNLRFVPVMDPDGQMLKLKE